MGRETATVWSEADVGSPHALLADQGCTIGAAPPLSSYLDGDRILDAAREMACDAIHPGYGFLSENAEFAEKCAAAGIVFIGPPPDAIRSMGDKGESRRVAEAAGTPPVPGWEGSDDDATLAEQAERIGYPVLVKATRGGGGKGMRRVDAPEELSGAIRGARREAETAFGDGTLLLERYIHPARHVEVQILADSTGRVIPVLERECSLQRRHQKVIEECPSLAVDPDLRVRLGEAAVRLGRAVNYVGAGTVEFLLENDGSFWFLEMNTRLQVEHGVTELVTGEDLVEWQVRIAEGEALTLPDHPEPCGWAIEARVYAEDPEAEFMPQSGLIDHLTLPAAPGVRVDAGVQQGQEVTPYYDPMLMKVLAHGSDRTTATQRLRSALEGLHVVGPKTNVAYLIDVLESDVWGRGDTFTHTLEAEFVPSPTESIPDAVLALAAWRLATPTQEGSPGPSRRRRDRWSPFGRLGPFRLVPPVGGPE